MNDCVLVPSSRVRPDVVRTNSSPSSPPFKGGRGRGRANVRKPSSRDEPQPHPALRRLDPRPSPNARVTPADTTAPTHTTAPTALQMAKTGNPISALPAM